jgi:hypothetical protein
VCLASRSTLHNHTIQADNKVANTAVPVITQTKLPIDVPTKCRQATFLTQIEKTPALNVMYAERIAGCACESDPRHS